MGPWFPRVQHFENGCCVDAHGQFDLEQCIQNVATAAMSSGIVGSEMSGLPSKARWGSMSEHDSEQAAGEMFFQLGPRTLALAFQAHGASDLDAMEENDYRKYVAHAQNWKLR